MGNKYLIRVFSGTWGKNLNVVLLHFKDADLYMGGPLRQISAPGS